MRINGTGRRLRVYFGESDRWQGRPLYSALLEALKREGLAGATVTRGLAGFGAHSLIHQASIERLSADLPLVLEVVDTPDRIEAAIRLLSPMVREGLITLEDVQILKYTHRELQPLPGDRPVREVMTSPVVSVTPTTPVADVMDLLLGRLLKAVPVVDEAGRVVGLISDGDLLARGGAPQRLGVAERLDAATLAAQLAEMRQAGRTAADVMSSPVTTAQAGESLAHAVSHMVAGGLSACRWWIPKGGWWGCSAASTSCAPWSAAHPRRPRPRRPRCQLPAARPSAKSCALVCPPCRWRPAWPTS